MTHHAATSNLHILITGEPGTGKRHLARHLHTQSGRPGPLVPLHTAHDLTLAEWFGHTRGAFTGALHDRQGLLAHAHTGSLLIHHVDDLPPTLQATLLRVLDTGHARPLGSNTPQLLDLRVLATTRREHPAARAHLRPDLYHRLAGFTLHVPPLREQPALLQRLAHSLLNTLHPPKPLAPCALRHLHTHSWPGNIRELHTTLTRAHTLAPDTIRAPHLQPPTPPPLPTLRDAEHLAIQRALLAAHGNVRHAARTLGVHPSTLYRKLSRLAPKEPTS